MQNGSMDLIRQDNYDTISDHVRRFCATQLMELAGNLKPYLTGDYGDIQPGHVTAYVTCIKELGRLYETHKRPRDTDAFVPAAQVAKMLEAAEARIQQAVQDAITETELRVRAELEASETKSLESSRSTVLSRLDQMRTGAAPG